MHLFSLHSLRREEKRFEEHYMPMTGDLFALAYRLLQDEEEARDIVQDVLGKLWQLRSDLPPEGADKPYCLTMVRNRCIDSLRQQQIIKLQRLETDEDTPSFPEPAADDFYAAFEAQDYLEYLLKELPPRARQLVELRLRDGFSFKEIELLTGISEGNARVILTRTLQQLRQAPEQTRQHEQK